MKARAVFHKRRSLQLSLLSIMIAIVVLTAAAMTIVIALASQNQGKDAQRVSREVTMQQAQAYLQEINTSGASEYNQTLKRITHEAGELALFLGAVYDNRSADDPAAVSDFEDLLQLGDDGQHTNEAEAASSLFMPNYRELDEAAAQDIHLGAYLENVFPAVLKNNPGLEAIYFATPGEVTRYYPNINLGSILPPDFQVTGRIWYVFCLPENNPERQPRWTNLYVDATGKGLVATVAAPVYGTDQNFLGVIGMDVVLSDMISKVKAAQPIQGGYSFLIDRSGFAIALPEAGYQHILERNPQPEELNTDLKQARNEFFGIIGKMMAGESGVESISAGGEEYFAAYAPLADMGWSMGSVIPAKAVLGPVDQLSQDLEQNTRSTLFLQILPLSLLILVGSAAAVLLTTRRIVKPLQELTVASQQMAEGEREISLPDSKYLEIEILTSSFQSMAAKIQQSLDDLEDRVASRTHALEKRSKQLQAAAESAREATATRDLEPLLKQTADLLHGQFGYSYAAVYLLDEKRTYAVLRAASGEADNNLLKPGLKVRLGDQGSVGQSAAAGKVRLNQGGDPSQRQVPFQLAGFRSEIAIPLLLDNMAAGVVLVASEEEDAFDDDDITILQIVADQTAVAIDNARLFAEVKESLQHMQVLYGRYSQDAWQKMGSRLGSAGYQYDSAGISPIRKGEESSGPVPLSLPLAVRGSSIGTLDVWLEDEALDETTQKMLYMVSERISQAMESARLFEEIRERMAREHALNKASARFSHSLDLDTLLQTAVVEMGQLPNVMEVSITIDPQLPDAIRGRNDGNGAGYTT
jgi:putative methionine-R-sulfoxide reductase with GAF domain/HAMP domain-containing protein